MRQKWHKNSFCSAWYLLSFIDFKRKDAKNIKILAFFFNLDEDDLMACCPSLHPLEPLSGVFSVVLIHTNCSGQSDFCFTKFSCQL